MKHVERRAIGWLVRPVYIALALTFVGGITTIAAPAATSRPQKPLCVRRRCTDLQSDRSVRVFQANERNRAREEIFQSTYARWLPTGRVTALGDSAELFLGANLGSLVLAGRYVAYALDFERGQYGSSFDGWSIYRLNAQTGIKSTVCADVVEKCEGYQTSGPRLPGVTDVAVTSTGSIGWITSGSDEATASTFFVYELPAGSKTPKATDGPCWALVLDGCRWHPERADLMDV
jgi:hypothetical protein